MFDWLNPFSSSETYTNIHNQTTPTPPQPQPPTRQNHHSSLTSPLLNLRASRLLARTNVASLVGQHYAEEFVDGEHGGVVRPEHTAQRLVEHDLPLVGRVLRCGRVLIMTIGGEGDD